MSKRGNSKKQPASGKPYLKLLEMERTFLIWKNEKQSVKDAPPDVFDAWIRQYVETILNVDTYLWDLFDRWQIINAVLDAGFLEFNGDTLDRKKNLPSAEEKSSDLVPMELSS